MLFFKSKAMIFRDKLLIFLFILAEFEVAGVILCTGPGAFIVGDACECTLDWSVFNADLGGCECIFMNGDEETGLVYNADINQCACGNIFEYINDRGVCRSFQLYHSFILQFLAVYKERFIHVIFIIFVNCDDDFFIILV